MKNILNKYNLMDMTHDEFIAAMRFALTEQKDFDAVSVNADFFDEIITRMVSLKEEVSDANGIYAPINVCPYEEDYETESAGHMADFAAELNEQEETARFEEFLDQLERDADEIGGDTGARIREAVAIIALNK